MCIFLYQNETSSGSWWGDVSSNWVFIWWVGECWRCHKIKQIVSPSTIVDNVFVECHVKIKQGNIGKIALFSSSLWMFHGRHHDLVNLYWMYVSQLTMYMPLLSEALPGRNWWFIFACVTRITGRMSVSTITKHPSSLPVISLIRIVRSLAFCVVFCGSLFIILSLMVWSLCSLSFDLRIPITN
jgi:hypothetical protein